MYTRGMSRATPLNATDTGNAGKDAKDPNEIGQRLRAARAKQKIGVRELARRVGVSASLISQIELGRAQPSVSTLYSIVQQLDLSLDQLFAPGNGAPALSPRPGSNDTGLQRAAEASAGPVVRPDDRPAIHLGSGVTWESLAPDTGGSTDFLYATYDVGGESAPAEALIRHGGREYGHVLEGRLGVTLGFSTHMLEPGDSIAFDSTTPHRLFNAGDHPVRAIWCVIGREDNRLAETPHQ